MKSSTAKAALALAIGLITATSAARADVFRDMGHDTAYAAKGTWHFTTDVARTVVYSPVIAYQVARGERSLFPQDARARDQHREQIALAGRHAPGH